MFNQNNRTDKLKVISQIVIAISFVVGICVFIGIKSVQKSRINTSVTTETTAESVAENRACTDTGRRLTKRSISTDDEMPRFLFGENMHQYGSDIIVLSGISNCFGCFGLKESCYEKGIDQVVDLRSYVRNYRCGN